MWANPHCCRLRGILTLHRDQGDPADAQIIFVDTPGIHEPLHRLGQLMVKVASSAIPDADVVMFMADLAKLGITLKVFGAPPAVFLDRIAKPETTPDVVLRPRASGAISWLFAEGWTSLRFPPNGLNEGYYYNEEFEALYNSAKAELDDAKRSEMLRRAADIALEEVAVIWIAAVNDVMCFTDELAGFVHSPWYMYVYWPYNLYRE